METLNELFNDNFDLRDLKDILIYNAKCYIASALEKDDDGIDYKAIAEFIEKRNIGEIADTKFEDFEPAEGQEYNFGDLDDNFYEVIEWVSSNFNDWRHFCDYANNEPTAVLSMNFEDYAREFADECFLPSSDRHNPLLSHINWKSWADEVQGDYSEYSNPIHNGEWQKDKKLIYIRQY